MLSAGGELAADGVLGAADMLVYVVNIKGVEGGRGGHFAALCVAVVVVVGLRM